MAEPRQPLSARPPEGLYDPSYEHDACGLGFVARIDGTKSHDLLLQALQILENMGHRGACGSDPCTGDGAGILFQVPHDFLAEDCDARGLRLPGPGDYAVGMVFLPTDPAQRAACESMLVRLVADEGLPFLGWRDVPVDPSRAGEAARDCMPVIRQCFIGRGGFPPDVFERRLFLARKRAEEAIRRSDLPDRDAFYVASLSASTVVYKGLLLPRQMPGFYTDLADPRVTSAIAVVHDRFSTNTFPAWRLAHPYRYVCHNGEINTLRGNVMWMRAREGHLSSDLFGPDLKKLFPILPPGQSDSASLDNAVEFLVMAGRSLPHAMMMLVPEAWAGNPHMDLELRSFYDYHNEIVGPWDGPAALVFTDGRSVGATLDPNGLRPARWTLTRDGLVVLSSEAGALSIPPGDIVSQDRLRPGEMILVDTVEGRLVRNDQVKASVAAGKPYREWLATHRINLDDLPPPLYVAQPDHASLRQRQAAFGYTTEELRMVLTPMAVTADEAVGSMGTDTPLAVLSERPQLLFKYFRQLFSQVTNPPIDPIREQMAMSLVTHVGPEGNLLDEKPEHAKRIRVTRPVLTNHDLEKIRSLEGGRFASITLPALFRAADGPGALGTAVDALCERASQAVREGFRLLILSDRGVDGEWAPIPALLATAAVNHHLIRESTRTDVGLIIETGEAREVHHVACLLAFGAGTINPYLAFESLNDLADEGYLPEGIDGETAQAKYIKALDKGLLKIFSKLGITSVRSYHGAQAMEAVGLGREVIDRYFTGLPSRVGGLGMQDLGEETLRRHRKAYTEQPRSLRRLDPGGEYHVRSQEERHSWSPEAIATLQEAVRNHDRGTFAEFCRIVDAENDRSTLRGLLEFVPGDPVPLDEVEPASEIVKRFCTGAMSYGSIGKEAHEALAEAMNRLGGKSNTGEGGEDPARFVAREDGVLLNSAIKQVASARFGVTTHYLVNAREMQIKISQGAKPGEGGQLPGHKVDEVIARTRHSTPGVTLISPPPHHDIYSIEDLAQLIYDLKSVNPKAAVSVKLVSEVGVGTVAAGVAKAQADKVVISGDTGGTGASPLSSIKNAGLPWELGVAETHQTLTRNGLRDRVRIETDGQLRTGRDVAIATLLGAEEFGFATAPLVSMGCILMRKCHLNTCPVGIATQDPLLRKNFHGRADDVVTYLTYVAEELRGVMAGLGFRHVAEMVGRADRLRQRANGAHWKARTLDLSAMLHVVAPPSASETRTCPDAAVPFLSDALDLLLLDRLAPALERAERVEIEMPIRNVNRAVGALLSGEVARRHGPKGLPADTIVLRFKGSAGQSFGAWCVDGVSLRLEGEANDYLGKGLSGGRIVVVPHREARFDPGETCLVGNVALYGATSGDVNIRGTAGERFGVRNSGARVVVEGVGDHGCEYMTGGVVVVLGKTGRNFAAGMSGGLAFVYDRDGGFERRVNRSLVEVGPVDDPDDAALLRRMVEDHAARTDSERARRLLEHWDERLPRFVRVISSEYRKVLEEREEREEQAVPATAAPQG